MQELVTILTNIILPIFALVLAGIYFERRFNLDINTLSKLNFYIFMPAFIFMKLVESQVNWATMGVVALFQVVLIFALIAFNTGVAKAMSLPAGLSAAFLMATAFCNSGNFGIPLVELAFPEDAATAVSYQAITVMVQNFLTFTAGLIIVGHGDGSMWVSLKKTLKLPFIYIIAAALLLKKFEVPVMEWPWLWNPVRHVGDGLVAVALLTLGVQIAKTPKVRRRGRLFTANFMRLLGAPAVAFVLVKLFGVFVTLPDVVPKLLVIAAAGPSAVNTVLIGIEFKNEPEFAASAVFYSTIFSAGTVALTIFLVRNFM